MIDLLKNIQGSPKSTALGVFFIIFGVIVTWLERATYKEALPFFLFGSYLFVKKDKSKNDN